MYAFFDPVGFSVLQQIDIQHIENEISNIVGNGAIHHDQLPTATVSGSAVTSPTGHTSLSSSSSSKTEQKSSTFIEFLKAC